LLARTAQAVEGLKRGAAARVRPRASRFGAATNLNIDLHCLVRDRLYRTSGDQARRNMKREAVSRVTVSGTYPKIRSAARVAVSRTSVIPAQSLPPD
jgi:hypothetical protein